jgi:GT2 family glycosyltransferase
MQNFTSKKVSIVLITWNGYSYLQKTIPKLLNLKYPDVEYIFIDNGSEDGGREYLEKIQKENKDKGIFLIKNKENLGISIAKNQGADKASGKYILFLDDDMLIDNPDFLSNLVSFYEKLDNPAFVMPFFLELGEVEKNLTRTYGTYYYLFGIQKLKPRKKISGILKYEGDIQIPIVQGGAMFIKNSIWKELGGFDESQMFNLDDDDISTRAMIYGYKNYLYNKEYILHLGITKRMDKKRYAWNDKTYFSGKSKAIWKNFSTLTIIWLWFFSSGRIIAESIYHSFTMKYAHIFLSTMSSVITFFKDIPDTLKKRKVIQKNRKIKDKVILSMKAPDYED